MRPLDQARLVWHSETGERRSAVALVEGVTAQEVTIRLPEALAAGQVVWVYEGTGVRATNVRDCVPQAKGFRVRLAFHRRRERRQPVEGAAVLHWLGPHGSRTARVQVHDVSDDGMRVELPEPVEVDQTVRLVGRGLECVGLVRYCRPKGSGFAAGIQFTGPPYEKKSPEYQD